MSKIAIIIGAGPAGLTVAYELLERTDIIPIIIEKSGNIGGVSKTISYKGNLMDMVPHPFLSKPERVTDWWLKIMPLAEESYLYQKIKIVEDPCLYKDNPTPKPNNWMLFFHWLVRIFEISK